VHSYLITVFFVVEERTEAEKLAAIVDFLIVAWEAVELTNFLESINRNVFNLMLLVVVSGEKFDRWNLQIIPILSIIQLTHSQCMYAFQLDQINQFLCKIQCRTFHHPLDTISGIWNLTLKKFILTTTCSDGSFSADQITLFYRFWCKNSPSLLFGHLDLNVRADAIGEIVPCKILFWIYKKLIVVSQTLRVKTLNHFKWFFVFQRFE